MAHPDVLGALSHRLRWRLVALLARSDRKAGELVELVAQPQNLVSYHLRLLRAAGLVTERRSSRDGRDIYYSLDVDRLTTALDGSVRAIHPALGVVASGADAPGSAPQLRVLFLCTRNSARSQMAEAILSSLGGQTVSAFSAGTHPQGVHPMAIEVLEERGIDHRGLRSKPIEELLGQRFDYVVSLCDRVREECPAFPGDPEQIHWSFPDPAEVRGGDDEVREAFRRTATELATRIHYLLLTTGRRSSPTT